MKLTEEEFDLWLEDLYKQEGMSCDEFVRLWCKTERIDKKKFDQYYKEFMRKGLET